MGHTRRLFWRSALAAVVCLALAACASNAPSPTARGPQRTEAATTPVTPPIGTPVPTSAGGEPPLQAGDGGAPDGRDRLPVTVPAGLATPAAIVAALEAQRGGRPVSVYWRELLLHGVAADAYLYINDPTKTDLEADQRRRSTNKAIAAMKLTETWHKGDPRPELPNFESVSQELATRAQRSTGVDILASNAACSTEGPERIDVVVVYRPTYADGSTDRTNRLVVVLDSALNITNAYYF